MGGRPSRDQEVSFRFFSCDIWFYQAAFFLLFQIISREYRLDYRWNSTVILLEYNDNCDNFRDISGILP